MLHSDDDTIARTASAPPSSDHVRLFGPEKERAALFLTPRKSTDWNTTTDALEFNVNPRSIIISFPREKADAIKSLLFTSSP